MVSVGVREQDGAQALPVEPELRHLRLERLRIASEARINQDQPFRSFDHVSRGRLQPAQEMDSAPERDCVRDQEWRGIDGDTGCLPATVPEEADENDKSA